MKVSRGSERILPSLRIVQEIVHLMGGFKAGPLHLHHLSLCVNSVCVHLAIYQQTSQLLAALPHSIGWAPSSIVKANKYLHRATIRVEV